MLRVTPENIHTHSKEGYLKFQRGMRVSKTKGKHELKLDKVAGGLGGGVVQTKTKPSQRGGYIYFLEQHDNI